MLTETSVCAVIQNIDERVFYTPASAKTKGKFLPWSLPLRMSVWMQARMSINGEVTLSIKYTDARGEHSIPFSVRKLHGEPAILFSGIQNIPCFGDVIEMKLVAEGLPAVDSLVVVDCQIQRLDNTPLPLAQKHQPVSVG